MHAGRLHAGRLPLRPRTAPLHRLERVVHESSQRASGALLQSVAAAGQPTADNPSGLYFVDTRQERTQMGDGRRVNKWYLVDQNGKEHLAVVGEERDTRDGHYTYK